MSTQKITPKIKDKVWKDFTKKSSSKNALKQIFLGENPGQSYKKISDKLRIKLTSVMKTKSVSPSKKLKNSPNGPKRPTSPNGPKSPTSPNGNKRKSLRPTLLKRKSNKKIGSPKLVRIVSSPKKSKIPPRRSRLSPKRS